MDELIDRTNEVLADAYMIAFKTEFFHWNVVGPDFPQYHEYFGDFYDEVHGSIDTIAEFIRACDGIPQNAPSMVKRTSSISEVTQTLPIDEMFADLLDDVNTAVKNLLTTMDIADKFRKHGLSNYLQERQAAFEKHAWMLKSLLKS